jgi:hypothetical protein
MDVEQLVEWELAGENADTKSEVLYNSLDSFLVLILRTARSVIGSHTSPKFSSPTHLLTDSFTLILLIHDYKYEKFCNSHAN